jgi:hypothetical protein
MRLAESNQGYPAEQGFLALPFASLFRASWPFPPWGYYGLEEANSENRPSVLAGLDVIGMDPIRPVILAALFIDEGLAESRPPSY